MWLEFAQFFASLTLFFLVHFYTFSLFFCLSLCLFLRLSCFLLRISHLHGILTPLFSNRRHVSVTRPEHTTMLTVARSFVGDRLLQLHLMRRKKYVKKRDIQYNSDTGKYHCPNCNNGYGRRDTMLGHYRYECGKAPRYKCPYCNLCSKKTSNIYQHVRCMHPKEQVTLIKLYWACAMSHEDHREPQREETRWERRGLKFSELIVKSDCL